MKISDYNLSFATISSYNDTWYNIIHKTFTIILSIFWSVCHLWLKKSAQVAIGNSVK